MQNTSRFTLLNEIQHIDNKIFYSSYIDSYDGIEYKIGDYVWEGSMVPRSRFQYEYIFKILAIYSEADYPPVIIGLFYKYVVLCDHV